MPVSVRPLKASDRDAWGGLWNAYLDFYGTELPQKVYDTTFARLLGDDPRDFSGLVAVVDDLPVGLAHYLFHRHCWRQDDVCYLQDLFAAPEMRGKGVGRLLIEAVYQRAGAASVYWLTQDDNATAQRLYDRIGQRTNFIKYQRPA